ncbi:nascent polypeptide-associated complex subunit alpha, muscle-specific form-like [Corapipo altera]|uniref:nascent polypeptide-associated complex subunit alpha, muscle-specific form-like n=1 Tax=Corapipo altera TaxID=415028 RepID=UPI000FD6ADED|nr:nascent polypeptide-associated complex subunit alpha, muscle-specific form-like [Corapipo altera]
MAALREGGRVWATRGLPAQPECGGGAGLGTVRWDRGRWFPAGFGLFQSVSFGRAARGLRRGGSEPPTLAGGSGGAAPRSRCWCRMPGAWCSDRWALLPPLSVLVECCARLCPALGSGTGSTPGTADPCARLGTAAGERCRTDHPERGAGAGQAPTPETLGQLWTEAELLPFPGTPARTAEPSGPQGSPRGPRTGGEGTGPAAWGGTATEHPGPPVSAGTTEQAAAGSELGVTSAGAPAPVQPDTDPATTDPLGTDPVGHVTVEGATTVQGTPLHSPPSMAVPASAGGQRGSPNTLKGWKSVGTVLVQSRRGSHSSLSPELWAGEGPGATVPLGKRSPGTHPTTTLATDSPVLGTTGMSPFGEGLQKLLTPTGALWGTHQGLPGPGLAGGQGSASRPWQGPHSAPHPSALSLGAAGHEGPAASTAWPAVGTGPASLPATGRGLGLPVPTTTAGTPGVTSSVPGGALDQTTGVLGPPDREGSPEHSHIPLNPPAVPGQSPAPLAPSSSAVVQSGVTHASPGSPHVPLSPQPSPASGAVTLLPTLLSSPGTGWGVLGLAPAVGTPPGDPSPRLPHIDSRVGPAESPQIREGTQVGVGSLAPPSASRPSQQPPSSQPASSLGPTTSAGITATAVAATITASTITASTITASTASPELPRNVGMVTPEPGAAVLQRDVAGLTWGPPTHVPTVMPGAPQQPTSPDGTLGHRGGPRSPPAVEDTDLAQPSSSPVGRPDTDAPRLMPAGAGRAPQVFIVEDQPPLLRASLLRVPCELVLDMGFVPALQDPGSREHQELLHSFNQTVTPLFTSVPGFLRLEVTGIREGSVVLQYDALFAGEQVPVLGLDTLLEATLGSGGTRPGLVVETAPVLRHEALVRTLDPCTVLFACPTGFACVSGADGNATCTSLCHRDYCKNQGICTHARDHQPLCQCPVGSDFWFMGLRCDYRVTQQSLLGAAAGILLSIVLLGAVLAALAVRRFKALLLEARADQTRSSYRRFCRLDDVSAQYWSRSGLPSASSLDNPAFSNSEELLHLQILDNGFCSCQQDSGVPEGAKCARPPHRPSFHYDWDTSSSSMNDLMVDSGKASDISVSSWPMEPMQWAPFPLLHQLSRQRPHKAHRPHSFCEGLELGTLERSWTA